MNKRVAFMVMLYFALCGFGIGLCVMGLYKDAHPRTVTEVKWYRYTVDDTTGHYVMELSGDKTVDIEKMIDWEGLEWN